MCIWMNSHFPHSFGALRTPYQPKSTCQSAFNASIASEYARNAAALRHSIASLGRTHLCRSQILLFRGEGTQRNTQPVYERNIDVKWVLNFSNDAVSCLETISNTYNKQPKVSSVEKETKRRRRQQQTRTEIKRIFFSSIFFCFCCWNEYFWRNIFIESGERRGETKERNKKKKTYDHENLHGTRCIVSVSVVRVRSEENGFRIHEPYFCTQWLRTATSLVCVAA